MQTWTLSTKEKKNIEEILAWGKDGEIVQRIEWWRWGSWILRSDAPPDIDLENPDCYDLWGSGLDWELEDMSDGVSVWWEWPDSMDEAARTAFEEAYDQDGIDGPADQFGWRVLDSEIYLHGPLELK